MLIKKIYLYTLQNIDFLNINIIMPKKIPQYLSNILKQNPKIKSGRKNYWEQHIRLLKQINLIKKYFKLNKVK